MIHVTNLNVHIVELLLKDIVELNLTKIIQVINIIMSIVLIIVRTADEELLIEVDLMKAKEMFEKLGYSLEVDRNDLIKYSKEDCGHIDFNFLIETKKFYSVYCFSQIYQPMAHSITLDEFEAVQKQMEELGWLEEEKQEIKQETNFEHYFEDLLKVGNRFTFINGKIENCSSVLCSKCVFDDRYCGAKRFKWLASPYEKPTYKLTQFEYDLLSVHKDFKDYNQIANQIHLFKMYEKGYFKGIDPKIPIREILDNCEVMD